MRAGPASRGRLQLVRFTTSTDDGSFGFRGVHSGHFHITMAAQGYVPQDRTYQTNRRDTMHRFLFRLKPASRD